MTKIKFSLTIIPNQKIPGEFAITKENLISGLMRDIETGDKEFDDIIRLAAPDPMVFHGTLNRKNRQLILKLAADATAMKIEPTKATANLTHLAKYYSNQYIDWIKNLNSILVSMSSPKPHLNQCIKIMQADSDLGVRKKVMHFLGTHHFNHPLVKGSFQKLLKSKGARNQIEASKYLGEEGADHLVKVINVSNQKIKALGEESIEYIAKTLTRYNKTKGLEGLKKAFYQFPQEEVRKQIMTAFEKIGDPSYKRFLTQNLKKHPDDELTLPIIRTLGTCGEVDTVEILYRLTEANSPPHIRQEARKSIDRIQSKIPGKDRGWLSVQTSEEKEGGLSLEEPEKGGGLSYQDPPEKD